MNYIDIVILVLVLIGAIRGFCRGLIIEIATLTGLALGIFVAIKYAAPTESFFKDFLNLSPEYASPISLTVTFLLVFILVYVLGKVLTKIVDIILLGLLNKLLGAFVGALKAIVLLCFLVMAVNALNEKFLLIDEETLEKSVLFHPFLNFAEEIYRSIRL